MAAMSDRPSPRLLPLVLIAAIVTLVLTVVRLLGERNQWDLRWFGNEAGGGFSPFGIVWLVPVFGFLFGRRLAAAGNRPPFVSSFFVPMFGLSVMVGALAYANGSMSGQALRDAMQYAVYGGPVVAVLALFAWPRAFFANLGYGLLARIPVVVVTWLDVTNSWDTHYGKVHASLPPMVADDRLQLLVMFQAGLWLPFTVLAGGAAAALGAATVRRA